MVCRTSLLALLCITLHALAGAAPAPAPKAAPPKAGPALKGAAKVPAPAPTSGEAITYLFVAEGKTAVFTPTKGANGTLVVSGVNPGIIYFSDTPARRTGQVPVGVFTTNAVFDVDGSWLNNPNAAVYGESKASNGTFSAKVLTLYSPVYDAATGTLTANATLVKLASQLKGTASTAITAFLDQSKVNGTQIIRELAKPHTVYNPALFIDTLVGFGDDFVGSFLNGGGGRCYGGCGGLI